MENGKVVDQLRDFLVTCDGGSDIAHTNGGLFSVASGVARQFEHFRTQVIEHGGQVGSGIARDVAFRHDDVNGASVSHANERVEPFIVAENDVR